MNRLFGFLLVLGLSLLRAEIAVADPVWDPTEITRLSSQAAQLASNLSTTIEILQSYDRLAREIGAVGMRGFTSQVPDAMRRYASFVSANMPTGDDAQAVLSGPPASSSQLQRTRQLWIVAHQKVAADGLAISMVVSQDSGGASSRSQSLATQAGNSQDLRSDIQTNSAVCLAVLSELGAIEAALAFLLEQQSSARLIKMTGYGRGA